MKKANRNDEFEVSAVLHKEIEKFFPKTVIFEHSQEIASEELFQTEG